MTRRPAALLLALLLLASPGRVGSETVSVSGDPGDAPGMAGAPGDPAGMGGTGGAGESVEACADALGESNTAEAFGGFGRSGGPGGDAADPGQPGGAGGFGGNGGSATAIAEVSGATAATATAVGGAAGNAGANGAGEPPLPIPMSPTRGGDANATATLEVQGLEAATVSARATAGDGGDAALVPPRGQGATPGGTGGDATAVATGNAGDGALVVEATALYEDDSFLPTTSRSSGSASATAFGANQGSGSVEVTARAGGADSPPGPFLPDSIGPLSASAEGRSQDGDVTVTAIVDRRAVADGGGPTELHDAVSGSTAGRLTLRQVIETDSGNRVTSLDASNPGGGDLTVEIDVGSSPLGLGVATPVGTSNTVLGDVVARGGAAAEVVVDVHARAIGSGLESANTVIQQRQAGDGSSVPSVIHGESDSGPVRVKGRFVAGTPLFSNDGTEPPLEGGAVVMENAVTGATRGDLELVQIATAGAGQGGNKLPLPGLDLTAGGDGGAARSVLTHEGGSSSLVLGSWAWGGGAGEGALSVGSGTGGTGHSVIDASNDSGAIVASARADGGGSNTQTGAGGDAVVDVSVRTSGDGHSVRIPAFDRSSPIGMPGAFGGDAERLRFLDPADVDLSDGGDATSSSRGVAEGDSLVEVFDRAGGGDGGGESGPPRGGTRSGGSGGDASSTAFAQGGGVSAVLANAEAGGGRGSNGFVLAGDGGDAAADATALGHGRVEAVAVAGAGSGGQGLAPEATSGTRGSAEASANASGASDLVLARASASGATGSATATANGEHGFARLGAITLAEIASQAEVSTQVGRDDAGGSSAPTGFDASALVVGDPLLSEVEQAVAGNAALAALVAEEPGAVFAIASWQSERGGVGAAERSVSLDITLAEDDTRDVGLAVFDVSLTGDGFERLVFRLEKAGEAFGDEVVFDSVAALLAFFGDTLLDVGPANQATDDAPALRAIFDVTMGDGDTFGMRVAYAVPEPSTGLLLGSALVLIAAWRRRRC